MTNKNTEKSEDLYEDYEMPQPYEEDIDIAYGNYLIAKTGLYKDKKSEDLTYEEIKELEIALDDEQDIDIIYGNYLIAKTGLYKDKKSEDLTYEEIKEMEIALDDELYPKKQITVKLYPETHKQLKIRATSEDTTINNMATQIVEKRVSDLDIVKYVENEFEKINGSRLTDHYESEFWNPMEEEFRKEYEEVYDYLGKKSKSTPMKRINVKVCLPSHKKLGVIGAIENKSLGTIVSQILEEEFGFIDVQEENEKMNEREREMLLKELENAIGTDIVSQINEKIPGLKTAVLVRILKRLEEK